MAGAGFTIRDYRPADFDWLWQIDQLCFVSGISYSKTELSSFIKGRNALTLVGEFRRDQPVEVSADAGSGEEIAGFVVAYSLHRKYGRIITLDVLPQARRSGLGMQLMDACEQRLRSLGCKEVFLETAVDNEPALRLYRKLGYEVLRTLPGYYVSHSLDAFQMGKQL